MMRHFLKIICQGFKSGKRAWQGTLGNKWPSRIARDFQDRLHRRGIETDHDFEVQQYYQTLSESYSSLPISRCHVIALPQLPSGLPPSWRIQTPCCKFIVLRTWWPFLQIFPKTSSARLNFGLGMHNLISCHGAINFVNAAQSADNRDKALVKCEYRKQ